ncbi:laminin subunit gamma-1-like [Mytilus edulis]|uniref:laminin subunit gamma-1-like n=1 Tax=Mytilus edulis TaxID=6550 RepID=UPI0039F10046
MMADKGKDTISHSDKLSVCKKSKQSKVTMNLLTVILYIGILPQVILGQRSDDSSRNTDCYDANGRPQRCMPEFINAAFGLPVEATNTCGVKRVTEYCLQTGVTGARKKCHYCDSRTAGLGHNTNFLTDFNNNNNWTWWQSETMLEGIQYPIVVNLTLNLKKQYEVTYIRLKFYSPRPESFAIYKRKTDSDPWIPWQFYSASCERTYNLPRRGIITSENEANAICTDEYSDISPLTGGSVPFSTLEGRPSAFEYENSLVLQDWVTASSIKISLTRLNTFGDEVFGDARVLKSYFYAISDLAVGARCKCNGHAKSCSFKTDGDLMCNCEHHTTGDNCEKCEANFNDRPWNRATQDAAFECLACDCNGKADTCYFDEEQYNRTGHGGHCIDCRDNTDGSNCQRCKENHYERSPGRYCTPCQCNPTGSENLQCENNGKCQCKPGVIGDKCNRCDANHYDFGPYGCQPCNCEVAGSEDNVARCNPSDGKCDCKQNVEGRACDQCKIGYFGLSERNPFGCVSCFCFGHSQDCISSTGYYATNIVTDFETGKQRWTASDRANNAITTQYNAFLQNLGVSSTGYEHVYFIAPARYLGNQRLSYNQFLSFDLRTGEEEGRASVVDIVLEGSGQKVSSAIFTQGNKMPGIETHNYKFRLNEHPNYQWTPRINAQDFLTILSNLTAIKIRATYSNGGVGFIDNIVMETARLGSNGGEVAAWVEQCTCPEGYVGQFCESCAAGYKRDPVNGGPFSNCVPCECFNHSDSCEPNSGRCICNHNTEGNFCERCVAGYYGNAREGTSNDCQPCPCPDGGPCVLLPGGEVVCTQCREGEGGNLCEFCLDGYFGDPTGLKGAGRPCERCKCNENIDTNAVGNCDRSTGECLKCIYNSAGFYCNKCLPNYYGDALAPIKGDCKACSCYPPGTLSAGVLSCDPVVGSCPCLPKVEGRQCDKCQSGYWNIDSGTGCEECNCSPIGSLDDTCDQGSGQCQCKVGVTGLKCDQCQRFFFGFSSAGCTACNCDPEGALDLQCGPTGNCPCKVGVVGARCDMCQENKYNLTAGCIDCAPCYSLVQERVNNHRMKLDDLRNLIINIGNNPSAFNDTQFLIYMNEVNSSVVMLLDEARGAVTDNGTLGVQLAALRKAVQEVNSKAYQIGGKLTAAETASQNSERDLRLAREAIDRAEKALTAAESYIDTEGRAALQRAREALAKFGQKSDQMTQIASRAKTEADRQWKDAERIEMLAKNALNTSREAKRLAEETLRMPDKTSDDITRLKQQYNDADRLYNQTRTFAESAKQRAIDAYDEALKLYTDATSIQLPGTDVPALKSNAMLIKREAQEIKDEAIRLMRDNAALLEDVSNQTRDATGMLKIGNEQQNRVDELLAEADAARQMARDATSRAEQTLKEASDTLRILLGFNQQVQENKDKADNALLRIPEIEAIIEEAEKKTMEAQDALSGAESDADMSLKLAQQAQSTAQNASNEASRIRQEADKTKEKATYLKDEADNLSEDVNNLEKDIAQREKQADDDSALTNDALKKASQAQNTARDVSTKVTTALNEIKNISNLLNQLDSVDTAKLDDLEKQLDDAEKLLRENNLDKQFVDLDNANNEVIDLVLKSKREYDDLKKDVENIEQIMNSLPDGCFKNIEIETAPGT